MNELKTKCLWALSHFMKAAIMDVKVPSVANLKVLHLSDNFVVVDKDCDIPINTDTPDRHPVTVATQLSHHHPHLHDPSVQFGFRFCHRLDYSTSGVLAVALNKRAAKAGYQAFVSNEVKKYYLGLVYGHLRENALTISKAVGEDSRPECEHRMCTSDEDYCKNQRWAISKVLVLQRGLYDGRPATKLLMKLVSGRRHQLRVHLHSLGHTVVGDFTYSDRTDILPYRMFLHSYRLVLPCELEKLDITTEDPFCEKNPKNKWSPEETVNELNDEVFSLL